MALRVVGTIKVLIVQQPCLVLTDMRHTYLHRVQFWTLIFHIEISYDKDAMKHKWNKKKFRNKMRISHVIFAFYCFSTMEQKHAIANTELWSHWHNTQWSLVTQPMLQLRLNWSELRSMDCYHQIFCRFWKCKRKVPPPSLLNFQKSPFTPPKDEKNLPLGG